MSKVMTFYRFADLSASATAASLEQMQELLQVEADALDLKGTVLLAAEGINGTLTGAAENLQAFAELLGSIEGLAEMPFKFSEADPDNPVFYRLKVRIKPEIVALGQPGLDPAAQTGIHVDAAEWNALLDDPDVIVIDTRNDYEIAIGSFPGAVNPGTTTFKQFPNYVAGIDPTRQPIVAMFCTGGIRCEKASAYMLAQGFEQVFQLNGGILKYLETVTAEDNRWQGECFVFDQRVSVDNSLSEGSFAQCFACRHPLSAQDMAAPDYVEGVSCPHCAAEQNMTRRQSFEERQRQVKLAAARGDQHLGKRMPAPPTQPVPSTRSAPADQSATSRGSR